MDVLPISSWELLEIVSKGKTTFLLLRKLESTWSAI